MELITLRTFDNSIDAHLIKSKLEDEGIVCFLFDEHLIGLNPLLNHTIGGIKLKINNSDYEAANSILKQIEKAKITNDEGEIVRCPNCHSDDILNNYRSMKGTKEVFSIVLSFFFMVFPIYSKTVHKCKNCGTEF